MQVDWGIMERSLARPDAGQRFMQGLEQGQQQRQKREVQNALAALGSGASDPRAMEALYRYAPEMALKFQDRQQDTEYRNALGDYYASGGRAPSPSMYMSGAGTSPQAAPNAPAAPNALLSGASNYLPPQSEGPNTGSPIAVGTGATAQPGTQPSSAPARQGMIPAGPDRRAIVARMMRANPKGAQEFLKLESEQQKARLELANELNERGLALIGGVTDQASFTRAREQAAQLYAQYGFDPQEVYTSVPEQYSPETVRMLQMQGMETKEQLAQMLNEDKFAWEVEDGQIDNSREARNTDSLIGYRSEQVRQGDERIEVSREGHQVSRDNRNNTPVATTTNERGETVIAYPDNRVTTLRGSRDTRGQSGGRGGRGGRSGRSDLIGPVYQRGNVRVQYSKSKQGYVDVATGAVVK